MSEGLYDITEVCKMLDVTSRTLRFYEEKGIIASEKSDFSLRRRYTKEQVEQIRNVLVLRTLGLSVKAIGAILTRENDLKSAVLARRAEIMASLNAKKRELLLLNDALARLEDGKPIEETGAVSDTSGDALARICAEAIIGGDTEALYRHMGLRLKEYMPRDSYEAVRADTVLPLGAFCGIDRFERDRELPFVVYCFAKYERLGLRIKMVFHDERLDGLWLTYYETEKENGL